MKISVFLKYSKTKKCLFDAFPDFVGRFHLLSLWHIWIIDVDSIVVGLCPKFKIKPCCMQHTSGWFKNYPVYLFPKLKFALVSSEQLTLA